MRAFTDGHADSGAVLADMDVEAGRCVTTGPHAMPWITVNSHTGLIGWFLGLLSDHTLECEAKGDGRGSGILYGGHGGRDEGDGEGFGYPCPVYNGEGALAEEDGYGCGDHVLGDWHVCGVGDGWGGASDDDVNPGSGALTGRDQESA